MGPTPLPPPHCVPSLPNLFCRLLAFAAVLTLFSLLATSATAAPIVRVEQVDTSDHPVIRARMTVSTSDHIPLTGLEMERFRLIGPSGPPRHPTVLDTVENAKTPLSVAFLIQSSGSWSPALPDARAAVAAFLRRMDSSHRAAVLAFADEVSVLTALDDPQAAIGALAGISGPGLEKRLLDGVEASLALFMEPNEATVRALVVLGDGGDSGSAAHIDSLLGQARGRGVPIHTVGWSRLGESGFRRLQTLSTTTGGSHQVVRSPTGFDHALERIRQSLLKQYVVEWKSRGIPADGEAHPIAIETTLGGSTIRHDLVVTTPLRPSRVGWIVLGLLLVALLATLIIFAVKRRPKPLRACGFCKREQLQEWSVCPFCLRASTARLRVVDGEPLGVDFPLVEGVHEVGTAAENAIRLTDPAISGHHCAVVVEAGRIEIIDRGSSNGTYVNGARIQRRALRHGDSLVLGRSTLRLTTDGSVDQSPSSPHTDAEVG